MGKLFDILQMSLSHCAAVSSTGKAAGSQVIEIALRLGGQFIHLEQVHPNPIGQLDSEGGLNFGDGNTIFYSHELLHREPDEYVEMKDFKPSGEFSYDPESNQIHISQGGQKDDPNDLDKLAHGQLAVGRLFYPHFKPKYGWIDQMSYKSMPSKNNVEKTELRCILWANFWGPTYVEKFGRKFLLGAPGWRKEELDDGGVLYVATESYFQWWQKPPPEVLDYFRKEVPGVRLYKAKKSEY